VNETGSFPTIALEVPEVSSRKFPLSWGIVAILAVFVPLMAAIASVDYQWTVYLQDHQVHAISDFVAQSLFSGEKFGMTDPVMMLEIVVLLAYVGSFYGRPGRLAKWRSRLGFMVTSTLLTAVGLVHTLKMGVGRARPREVFKYGLHYSPWHRFGSHHLSEGVFSGSFPSGHTATVAILIAIVYLIGGNAQANTKRRVWACFCGGFAFCYAGFVTLGRSMGEAHWLSDCLGSVGLAWLCAHILYFHVLRIPQQEQYVAVHGKPPALPRFWEIKFSGCVLATAVSLLLTVVGARALLLGVAPWMGVSLIVGPVLAWLFWKLTLRVHSVLRKALA
jgi:membrane-associated phospholipid phosphatase